MPKPKTELEKEFEKSDNLIKQQKNEIASSYWVGFKDGLKKGASLKAKEIFEDLEKSISKPSILKIYVVDRNHIENLKKKHLGEDEK